MKLIVLWVFAIVIGWHFGFTNWEIAVISACIGFLLTSE